VPKRPDRPDQASPPSLATSAKEAAARDRSDDESGPQYAEVEYTDREGHRWTCRVGFTVVAGRLQPVSFEIRGADVARRITTALVRGLPVATIEEQARRQIVHHAEVRLAFEHALGGPSGGAGLDEARRNLRRVRGPASPFLALVAGLYRQALAAGDQAPAKTIARAVSELRGQTVTPVAARNWIRRCRQLGLLPPADRKEPRP
jgi:hypothetical protein